MIYPNFTELSQLVERASRLRLKTKKKTMAARGGDYASPFRGQGLEFHEVREYRLGDDVRNIDWRVTARMERPYLKVFTEEKERTVLLCIDANADMRFGTRGTFKSVQAARAAALLGWMAQSAGDKIGTTVFGDVPQGLQFFAPVRGRRALWQTLKLLSRPPNSGDYHNMSMEKALIAVNRTAPTGALVFVVSDFAQASDEMEMHLANLRRRCDVILVRIEDPADRSLGSGPVCRSIRHTGLTHTDAKRGGLKCLKGKEKPTMSLPMNFPMHGMKFCSVTETCSRK